MKINYKYFSVLALVSLMFASCDDGNAVVDTVTADTTRGAILRTVNVISNELPIGKADASFAVELEIQDSENGKLVDNIEVFIGFRDNTVETGATDLDKAEVLVATLPSSGFTEGPFGFPRLTYTIALADLLSTLGVDEAELDGGDQFSVRFELVLNDGRRFSFAQNSGTLTGSFFASPFLYTPGVTCPVEATQFVGDYLIEQTTPYVDGPSLSDGTVVSLVVGSTSVERIFQTANYALYCSTLAPFTINFICGEIAVPNQNSNCVCADGGDWFTDPIVRSTYDPNDDSVFEVTFTDDTQSDCGSPVQTTYKFTKQ
tara:strand:- start:1879 stop:2826 length:948 start_codon:yes stop_codon:yes gene_type:complete